MSGESNKTKGDNLVFYVNGVKVTEANPDPEMTLLTYLRTKLRLTGAKLGCGEGGCGACTVMVSRYMPALDVARHYTVNACLAPLCSIHGLAVTTVEGIGNMKNIHPVQERIAKFHGSQCGFCTPGIVMSMYTLLRNNHTPTDQEMEEYFDGNLCRCTGYRPILDGFRTFTKEFRCALGDQCCQNRPAATDHSKLSAGSKGSASLGNGDHIINSKGTASLGTSSKGTSLGNGDLNEQDHLTNGYKDSDGGHAGKGCSTPGARCCQGRTAGRTAEQSDVDTRNIVVNGVNGGHSDDCCGLGDESNTGTCRGHANIANIEVLGPKLATLKPYDPSQEAIFPPDLKVNYGKFHGPSHKFVGPNVTWIQPSTLIELTELKARYPDAKLVVGNTEIGVETKFKNMKYPILISTTNVPELQSVLVGDDGVTVGASVTLSQLSDELKKVIRSLPEHKTRVMSSIVEMLQWFAGHQIRNVASLSGNILTASPISDMNPLLLAAGATVCVQSQERGRRSVKIDGHFFCGYRQTALASDEVLLSVLIPFTRENEHFAGYKQANRKDDDISLVTSGMKVALSKVNTINKATLAFGGMGVTTMLAHRTMQSIIGHEWTDSLVSKVSDLLASDLPLSPGAPGGFVEYRQALALSFFFKFFVTVQQRVLKNQAVKDLSAIQSMEKPACKSMQVVGGVDARLKTHDVVGKPIVHSSALQQSTGEAIYLDDMPPVEGELHMALVTSTRPHSNILRVDPSRALSAPGVVDFVTAADIPGVNNLGIHMDTVFATKEVTCQGQVIGAIVAETQALARNAARLVDVQYQDKQPVIITIEDAIKHESYFTPFRRIQTGNLEAGFAASQHVLEGEVRIGGQNHFYMETMATRVLPGENGELEVFASTQNPSAFQLDLAKVLGVPSSKIVVRVKRLGGGFGGKESQIVLSGIPAAVAARKLGRAVRCVLDRDVDMVTTGNRHPFLGKYKVGFTPEGKILALDLELYSNAGNSLDLSYAVIEKAIMDSDASICIPNMRIVGRACRTNILSNTAFRGFGAPQGMFISQAILDEVASFLSLSRKQIQERNFFPSGALTHYGMPAGGESIQRCWDLCLEKSQFYARTQNIDRYNREHRWKKKGIALTPMRFGVSFLQSHMNQAGALVHIYRDGYVLVAHSGTEMGQGLNIKVAQIASEVLEIPLSLVHISETATNAVPNTSPTAASVGTDINGMAVKNACEVLKDRLRPYFQKMPGAPWEKVVDAAYLDMVSLSTTGFYATPDIGYNMETQTGKPYAYYTFGAACTEVQIDCLTGDHKLLRTDIVMDVGNSVNPAIDVGQIEGAFAQGCGLHLLEDVKVTPDGSHLTRGPGNYKIPAFGNIPAEFNVYLVPDSPNPKAVFASRAVGEPPLLLASSAFFAVKDAIRAARKDGGAGMKFRLDSPALPADIRMACQDVFAKKFPKIDPKTYTPWAVTL
ncbi:hypothetical protein BsWGS_10623 [Bradybaena similaris]